MVPRILIVDDDPALRRALLRVLRGFELATAETAIDAKRVLADATFDAILTDFGIPGADGVALLRDVQVSHPSMRRYLMSGFDTARFEALVESKLVHRLFSKPIDLVALRAELAEAGRSESN